MFIVAKIAPGVGSAEPPAGSTETPMRTASATWLVATEVTLPPVSGVNTPAEVAVPEAEIIHS